MAKKNSITIIHQCYVNLTDNVVAKYQEDLVQVNKLVLSQHY
jgi:hypothetical protein